MLTAPPVQTAPPAQSRRLTRAKGAVALALAAASLLTLGACQKPTPGVTVFSGTHSDHTEAICWSPDADRAVNEEDCSFSLAGEDAGDLIDQIPNIPTDPGATVGISVDPTVAEDGWIVSINSRALVREPITEKYFKFTMPPQALRRSEAQLIVQALTSNGDEIRGSWVFSLSRSPN